MTWQNWAQLLLLALAAIAFLNGWTTPTPYGGDAGLGDAMEKLVSYAGAVLLILAAAIWYMVWG